jgi:hypothetical protein
MNNLLWTVITVLVILWLLGTITSFGGPLIHLILVVAVVIVVFNLLTKGKPTL